MSIGRFGWTRSQLGAKRVRAIPNGFTSEISPDITSVLANSPEPLSVVSKRSECLHRYGGDSYNVYKFDIHFLNTDLTADLNDMGWVGPILRVRPDKDIP